MPFQVENKLCYATVRHLLRGPMDEEDKEKALKYLLEQSEAFRVPFTFHFVFRNDVELLMHDCHGKMGLIVNCSL
ncbi:hypothetical protein QQF64_032815 [Cirrhinus molitorella]|uniref:Uncharacterized protein n=1 Tax=Cirrhinus molitorella TaxID=172907 RepID=A0ABR3MS28_9TELE